MSVTSLVAAASSFAQPPKAVTRQPAAAKPFAQKLVEDTLAAHPELEEVEIAAVSAGRCTMIASTSKEDLGEKCERDSTEPMRTGKPFIEKEKTVIEVSLPLHDVSGAVVGAAGIAFKAKPGQAEAAAVDQARRIVTGMESHVASLAVLLGR
jgi:hypothetical protein